MVKVSFNKALAQKDPKKDSETLISSVQVTLLCLLTDRASYTFNGIALTRFNNFTNNTFMPNLVFY